MKMRPEVKAKWLAALRSGEYRQAREHLHVRDEGDRFCCLGVLCEIAANEGVVVREADDGLVTYDDKEDMPPRSVRIWAFGEQEFLPHDPWEVAYARSDEARAQEVGLATLNDEYGLGFAEIADAIEASL